LGHHEGGYTPFEFDLTEALKTEQGQRHGLLVFRVEDPMDNSEQPVGKQWRWYTTTSGIWQTVFIEPRHETHIKSFRLLTDIDTGTVQLRVSCLNAVHDCDRSRNSKPANRSSSSASPGDPDSFRGKQFCALQ